jgi:hypothetical protein
MSVKKKQVEARTSKTSALIDQQPKKKEERRRRKRVEEGGFDPAGEFHFISSRLSV